MMLLSSLGINLTILAVTVIIGVLLVVIVVVLNKLTRSVIKKVIKNRTELENVHHAIVVESKLKKKQEIPFAEFIKNMDSFEASDVVETATVDIYDKKKNKIGQMKITGKAGKHPMKKGIKIRI